MHVARMGERGYTYRVWWQNLKERNLLENLGLDGKVILKRMLKEYGGIMWTRMIWLRVGTI